MLGEIINTLVNDVYNAKNEQELKQVYNMIRLFTNHSVLNYEYVRKLFTLLRIELIMKETLKGVKYCIVNEFKKEICYFVSEIVHEYINNVPKCYIVVSNIVINKDIYSIYENELLFIQNLSYKELCQLYKIYELLEKEL